MTEWIRFDKNDKSTWPNGNKVLICFNEPFFGYVSKEISVGYFDSPDDYEDPEMGTGWRFWNPDKPVLNGVTHWQTLPEPPTN